MTIIRWILGVLTALLGGGTALAFLLFIINGADEWLGLAKKLQRWVYAVVLLWFNIEIWRRVILVIIHW